MMGAVTAEWVETGQVRSAPHTARAARHWHGNGARISRTVFTQGPHQGYLRHAQITLFGKFFDASGGRGEVMGSLRVKLMINKGRRFSPFDDFFVGGFLEVIVVPSEQDKEERSFGQNQKKGIYLIRTCHFQRGWSVFQGGA